MTIWRIIPALAALALAGCQSGAPSGNAATDVADEANTVADNTEAGNNVAAQVIAMNDQQRNAVFIRAILDAGLACERVESSERLPDQDGDPLWRAHCKGAGSHMIAITPDGTAKIISRTDR